MEMKISNSPNPQDYEILIRKRGDGDYASYCPQLNLFIKGEEHELVRGKLKNAIDKHCEELQRKENELMAAEEMALAANDINIIPEISIPEINDDITEIDKDEFTLGLGDDDLALGLDDDMGIDLMSDSDEEDLPL